MKSTSFVQENTQLWNVPITDCKRVCLLSMIFILNEIFYICNILGYFLYLQRVTPLPWFGTQKVLTMRTVCDANNVVRKPLKYPCNCTEMYADS